MLWHAIAAGHLLLFLIALPATADSHCTGTSGRVLDHRTGAPIANARVSGGLDSSAVTDAQGCFVLRSVYTEACIPTNIDCAFRFAVSADGYVPYGENGYRPPPDRYPFYAEVRLARIVAETPTPTPTPTVTGACEGDCDGNAIVTVNELVTMVNIALGRLQMTACPGLVATKQAIAVNEIVEAVTRLLRGCGAPLPTATPGPFAAGRCSESPNCDPCDVYPCRPFGASRSFCCDIARAGGTFSWCEVVDATGFCTQCASACADLESRSAR